MLKIALSHPFPMFSGIDCICGGAEELISAVVAAQRGGAVARRNPLWCCTDETHSSAAPVQPGMDIGGIITPTVSFVLILSLSQMGIYSLAHFFILMYGQEKKSSSNS